MKTGKLFISKIALFLVVLSTVFLNCSFLVSAQSNDCLASPEEYISYLETFGDEYKEFIVQFEALPLENQEKILDVLKNGGEFDVKVSKRVENSISLFATYPQRSVYYDADFELFGITFVTIRLEGRFGYSGSTVMTADYTNAYIVRNWVPLSGFSRSSLDGYVSGGKYYASAAFTAYVGAKIGDNIIGVTPRTFYINLSCDGNGIGTGNAW